MRIYFVGSHATGKTTLCRYVSRRYGLPMISEVARAVLAEMETSLDALRTPGCYRETGVREFLGVRYTMHEYQWERFRIWMSQQVSIPTTAR